MNIRTVVISILLATIAHYAGARDLESFFANLRALKFDEAKKSAASISDSSLRAELINLADLLYYGGQKDKNHFVPSTNKIETKNKTLSVIRQLNAGYYNLFYDQLKGDAYRCFHQANRIAKETGDVELIKACAYAFLKYYGFEIAQNGNSYQSYLQTLETLQSDSIDALWTTLYQMIFMSKSMSGLDSGYYFKLAKDLDLAEVTIDKSSPLLAYMYYETALSFSIAEDFKNSAEYYQKTIDQSKDFPFLNTEKFLSLVKLMVISTNEGRYKDAHRYWKEALLHRNRADTLRSEYYLNLYGSMLLKRENKNDSAFQLLLQAYRQDFLLDFRRNTFEINRLNVELETQEKENANLKLRETRIWLTTALLVTGLICVAVYFAYANQKTTNKILARNNEVEVEKLLKEQELIGINSMLEGQEKERQNLANELHDNLGSVLTALKFHFHTIKKQTSNSEKQPEELLEHTDKLLDEAYQKIRTIAHLRNTGVDPNEGLLPAIKSFASKISKLNTLSIEVNDNGMDKRLDNTLEITVFRILQELVANVIKHAKATTATIHLTRHDQSMNIMVEDNGIGFDATHLKSASGMGLYSIQKRVESLGGIVTIESTSKSGTTVIIDIPIVA